MNGLKPLYDRVAVLPKFKDKTLGGLYIPEEAKANDATHRGTVLAIGDHKSIDVAVDDEVIYLKHEGVKLQVGGEEVIIMRQDAIIGTLHYS